MNEAHQFTIEAPTWDLSDLYAAGDDPAIDRDLDAGDAKQLDIACRGRIARLTRPSCPPAWAHTKWFTSVPAR
jgi:hypothetical protein